MYIYVSYIIDMVIVEYTDWKQTRQNWQDKKLLVLFLCYSFIYSRTTLILVLFEIIDGFVVWRLCAQGYWLVFGFWTTSCHWNSCCVTFIPSNLKISLLPLFIIFLPTAWYGYWLGRTCQKALSWNTKDNLPHLSYAYVIWKIDQPHFSRALEAALWTEYRDGQGHQNFSH